MEKCSNVTTLCATGTKPNEGFLFSVGSKVAALYIMRQIGSPFLSKNFLSNSFLEQTWAKVAVAIGAVRVIGELGTAEEMSKEYLESIAKRVEATQSKQAAQRIWHAAEKVYKIEPQTCQQHQSSFIINGISSAVGAGVLAGLGYIFPRVTSFCLLWGITNGAGMGMIRVGKEIFSSSND
ncbi:MAG: hypothetical protein JSR80_01435 [Verrucomicrobia bacterium]|nr:hypothetical protein [Verrucomicrobiota bacterium]